MRGMGMWTLRCPAYPQYLLLQPASNIHVYPCGCSCLGVAQLAPAHGHNLSPGPRASPTPFTQPHASSQNLPLTVDTASPLAPGPPPVDTGVIQA